jgi:hypothetical protein
MPRGGYNSSRQTPAWIAQLSRWPSQSDRSNEHTTWPVHREAISTDHTNRVPGTAYHAAQQANPQLSGSSSFAPSACNHSASAIEDFERERTRVSHNDPSVTKHAYGANIHELLCRVTLHSCAELQERFIRKPPPGVALPLTRKALDDLDSSAVSLQRPVTCGLGPDASNARKHREADDLTSRRKAREGGCEHRSSERPIANKLLSTRATMQHYVESGRASRQPPSSPAANTLLPRRGLRPLATAVEVVGLA